MFHGSTDTTDVASSRSASPARIAAAVVAIATGSVISVLPWHRWPRETRCPWRRSPSSAVEATWLEPTAREATATGEVTVHAGESAELLTA